MRSGGPVTRPRNPRRCAVRAIAVPDRPSPARPCGRATPPAGLQSYRPSGGRWHNPRRASYRSASL